MIQIRNVPDALHRQLKSRAALAGCRFPTTCSAKFARWPNARHSLS
ncbi:MAG: hypothetical protein ACHP84_09790 [Caulobacterales bacterium]